MGLAFSPRMVIKTKYYTDEQGRGRVVASCEAGTAVVKWAHDLSTSQNHAEAAKKLANKQGWPGQWAAGSESGYEGGYTFVFVDALSSFVVEAPKPARKVLTLDEIREAVKAGKTVHWSTTSYDVKLWSDGKFVIACPSTNYAIGLSYVRDGVEHVNAKLEEFFLGGAQ